MEPWQLLETAVAAGLQVRSDGNRLVVRGPRTADSDLIQALLRRKAELMSFFTLTNAEDREQFEERVAIAEYEGKLSRTEAEWLAWEEMRNARTARIHCEEKRRDNQNCLAF